jgi:thioredoxin reductase
MAGNGASTEVIIVGAGPVGPFSVFQLGLARLKAHVV